MSDRTLEKIELHPSEPSRRLSRPRGFKQVSLSVGLNGEAFRLLVQDNLADAVFARTEKGRAFASFPKTQTEQAYVAIFATSGPSGSRELRISGLMATFPKIQTLPGNEVLVVATRCQRFNDGSHEMNAKVYGSEGSLAREFLLGDGIKHVQTDVRGNVWVGYFDEGVYGNFGWQDPLGAAGLSCFSDTGQKLWDFRPPEGFDYISDCYALNVCRNGVWAYYYTDFPFARIDADWTVRCWKTESSGGSSFAIAGEQALLYSGYNEKRTACKLFQLADKGAELVADVRLVLPSEVDLSKSIVIGRNGALHVFSGDDWYLFSIESLCR